jgi:hypothetical protein
MNDRATLLTQRNILTMREAYLKEADPANAARIDLETMSQLRLVSSSNLQPIFIQRNNSDWVAAYLVQNIGDRGKRILLRGDSWRIFRARKSARVITVESTQLPKFEDLVRLQEAYFVRFSSVFAEVSGPRGRITQKKGVKKCQRIRASMA